jgi:uncharacterized protein
MKMTDTVHIAAAPDEVWRALTDPAVLRAAIPGCQTFEAVGDGEFQAAANVAIGPVRSVFSGNLRLFDVDPPHSYRVSGEGHSTNAGTAAGTALIRLTPTSEGTDVHYEVDATVGGKIAQIGQRFVDQAAKKMAEDFFLRFTALLEGARTKSSLNMA